MKVVFGMALVAMALPIAAQTARSPAIAQQVERFEALHQTCMSDSVENKTVRKACDDRDKIVDRLQGEGYCFGTSNLAPNYRRWAKCTQPVRVFVTQPQARPKDKPRRFVQGDTVPAAQVLHVLHVERACELDMADRSLMFAYADTYGSQARHGCWQPTVDEGYVVVYGNGETSKQPMWRMMPRATLNPDGSATITEPGYDSETYLSVVNRARLERQMEKMRRGEN